MASSRVRKGRPNTNKKLSRQAVRLTSQVVGEFKEDKDKGKKKKEKDDLKWVGN